MQQYRVGIIAPANGLSVNQQAWFDQRIKEVVTGAMNLGAGEEAVLIKVCRHYGNSEAWPHARPRPVHCRFDNNPPNWTPNGMLAVVEAFRLWGADEVWCFGHPGQTALGRGASSRVFRYGLTYAGAGRSYKFIPSWVTTETPDSGATPKTAKKGTLKCLNSWS